MAPSTAIQARIAAFEGRGSSKDLPENTVPFAEFTDSPSHSESTPSLSPATSSLSFPPSSPPKSIDHSPSMSSSCRTSVLDLKDWVIDDGPGVLPSALRDSAGGGMNGHTSGTPRLTASPRVAGRRSPPNYDLDSTPLISFESSPPQSRSSPKGPPLPPRKPSLISLRSASSPINISSSNTNFGSSSTSRGSHMLKPPEVDHPPNLSDIELGKRGGHAPASSISSFHSLSLSSDGGTDSGSLTNFVQSFAIDRDKDREWQEREGDGDSLNDSFEDVSVPSSFIPNSSFIPPSRNPLAKPPPPPPPPPASKSQVQAQSRSKSPLPPSEPPKLPQRPKPRVSVPPSLTPSSSAPSIPTSTSNSTYSTITGRNLTSSPSSPAGSRLTSPTRTPSAHSTGSGSNTSASAINYAIRRVPPPPPPPSSSTSSHGHTHGPPPSHISRSKPSSSRSTLPSSSASASASTSASDRSSILSYGSTSSRTSFNHHPPPPKHYSSTNNYSHNSHARGVGLNVSGFSTRLTSPSLEARVRYDAVFDANIRARRKAAASGSLLSPLSPGSGMKKSTRQNAGWRGLSVDLITNGLMDSDREEHGTDGNGKGSVDGRKDGQEEGLVVEKGARLEGKVVKMIWMKSKLDKSALRDIWLECDPHSQGSLDRQGFALGMWRIDTELDKAHKARRAALLSSSSSRSLRFGRRQPNRADSSGSVSLIQM